MNSSGGGRRPTPRKLRDLIILLYTLLCLKCVKGQQQDYPAVAPYNACGGLTNHACELDSACAPCLPDELGTKFECVKGNAYFYQCLPAEDQSGEEQSSEEQSGEEQDQEEDIEYDAVANYGTCGGLSEHPCGLDEACSGCISDNFVCQRGNAYYWQCRPDEGGDDNQNGGESGESGEEQSSEEQSGEEQDQEEDQNESPNEDVNEENDENDENDENEVNEVNEENEVNENGNQSDDVEFGAVGNYATCGGLSEHPCGLDEACSECINDNFVCQRGNAYYWQCRPRSDEGGNGGEEQSGEEQSGEDNQNGEEEQQEQSGEEQDQDQDQSGDTGNENQGQNQSPGQNLAKTTRFFDGCKPTCAWSGNIRGDTTLGPVFTCSNQFEDGVQVVNDDPNLKSVCGGGGSGPGAAYTCVDRSPFTSNGQMYAFAASNSRCCECYELTFLASSVDGEGNVCSGCSSYSGELEGETLVVQVINSGGDLSPTQFDLMIPGGGMGIFNGLVGNPPNGPPLFPQSSYSDWGQRYGGVSSREQCFQLPASVVPGCLWRFDDFKGADNPGVSFRKVKCGLYPELYEKSGCLLSEDVI